MKMSCFAQVNLIRIEQPSDVSIVVVDGLMRVGDRQAKKRSDRSYSG